MAWFAVVFWAALAYLVLPRVHRILTRIYLPDYFIGRARTSDGLLGDPVNMALLGSGDQIHAAMRRAGWTQADDVDLASSRRIILSTLTRRSYERGAGQPAVHLWPPAGLCVSAGGRREPGQTASRPLLALSARVGAAGWRPGRLACRRHVRPLRRAVPVHPADHAQDRGEHRRRKRPHPGRPDAVRPRGGRHGHPGFFDRIPRAQRRRRHDFHRRGLAGGRPLLPGRGPGRAVPCAGGQPAQAARPDPVRRRSRLFSRNRCPRPRRLTADRRQSRRRSRACRSVDGRCDCARGVRRRRDPPGLGRSAGRKPRQGRGHASQRRPPSSPRPPASSTAARQSTSGPTCWASPWTSSSSSPSPASIPARTPGIPERAESHAVVSPPCEPRVNSGVNSGEAGVATAAARVSPRPARTAPALCRRPRSSSVRRALLTVRRRRGPGPARCRGRSLQPGRR